MFAKGFVTVDLTRYIDKTLFDDRPHIRGRRIPVWVVAHAMIDNKGVGIPELMYSYDLSEVQALAALLYYAEHREEIEAQETAIREQYEHLHENDATST